MTKTAVKNVKCNLVVRRKEERKKERSQVCLTYNMTTGIWNFQKSVEYQRLSRYQRAVISPSSGCPLVPLSPSFSFSFPFLLCSGSPFYCLFARWKLSSHCTHYRYLRPADHHHQLISYRRRSSAARGHSSFFFSFLKSNDVIRLGHSRYRVLIVSTATMNNR